MSVFKTPWWSKTKSFTVSFSENKITSSLLAQLRSNLAEKYTVLWEKQGGHAVVFGVYDNVTKWHWVFKTSSTGKPDKTNGNDIIKAEAALWLQIPRHPNIVTAESFENLKGTPFIVLEYIFGETLSERLARGPLDDNQLLRLVVDICEGMSHLKKHGIECHRDLSPNNILITPNGRAKLIDLGSALNHDKGAVRKVVAGTLPYMAPEQFQGQEDTRSDIYSLGMILFHSLLGHPPFEGKENKNDVPPKDIIYSYWKNHSSKNLPKLGRPKSKIVESMQYVISICTAKNPNDRFRNFNEVLFELEAILRGTPRLRVLNDKKLWHMAELFRYEGHYALRSMGIEPGISLLAEAILFLDNSGKASESEIINAIVSNVSELKSRAGQVLLQGDTDLALTYVKIAADILSTPIVGLKKKETDLINETRLSLERLRESTVSAIKDKHLVEVLSKDIRIKVVGAPDSGNAFVSPQADVTGKQQRDSSLQPSEKRDRIECLFRAGRSAASKGLHRDAVVHYQKTLQLDSNNHTCRVELGFSLNELSHYSEAITQFDKILKDNPEHPTALWNKGFSLERLGKYEEAVVHYRCSANIEPENAIVQVNIGQCLLKLGKISEAKYHFEKVLESNPRQTKALHGVFRTAIALKSYNEALSTCYKLIELNDILEDKATIILLEHLFSENRYGDVLKIVNYFSIGGESTKLIFENQGLVKDDGTMHLIRLINIENAAKTLSEIQVEGSLFRMFREMQPKARISDRLPDFYHPIIRNVISLNDFSDDNLQNLNIAASKYIAETNTNRKGDASIRAEVEELDEIQQKNAIAIYRKFSESWSNLRFAAWRQQGYDTAQNDFQTVLSYGQKGQYDIALRLACVEIKRNPYDERFLGAIGICLKRLGWVCTAILAYESSLYIAPLERDAFHNLGLAYMELERWDDTLYYFEKALVLCPYATTLQNYFEAIKRKRIEDENVSKETPNATIDQMIEDAHRHMSGGNLWEAQVLLKTVMDRPGGEKAMKDLGLLYYHMGMYAESSQTLDQVLNLPSASKLEIGERKNLFRTLGMAQGQIAIETNDKKYYQDAISSLEASLADSDGKGLHLIGGLHCRFGAHASAIDVFDKALNTGFKNDILHGELALSLAAIGEHKRAIAEAEYAVRSNPNNAQHRKTLETVRKAFVRKS